MIRFRNLLSVTLSVLFGSVVVALLVGAATRFSEAPAMIDIAQERCPNKIEDFKNSVTWYRGKNRITFHAKEACGTKLGDAYDLTDVTLDVRSGDRVITQIHSDTGAFFIKSHEVLVGKTDQANPKGCLVGFDVMTVDLISGELRTPGYRTFLNTVGPVQCNQRVNHA